jgi:2-polyprenyl-3-methyl-5-hydroxy-6-metoxy-1,4-benzoquinol methylase
MTRRDTDAFGAAIQQYFHGRVTPEVIERDDGWIEVSRGATAYFADFDNWPARERAAARYARGRILDVGCGAGRVSATRR